MQSEIIETMKFMLSPYGRRVSNLDDLAPCLDKMTLLAEEEDRIIVFYLIYYLFIMLYIVICRSIFHGNTTSATTRICYS